MENNQKLSDIPEFSRALRGLIGLAPHEIEAVKTEESNARKTVRKSASKKPVAESKPRVKTKIS